MKKSLCCKILLLMLVCVLAGTTAQVSAASQKAAAGTKAKSRKRSGWYTSKGKTYYYVKGKKVTGKRKINGETYYFNKKGVMQRGWQKIGKYRYYFGTDGVMQRGWRTLKGKTYYFRKRDGHMKTGWLPLGGKRYHFTKKGVLETGRKTIGDASYYFSKKTGAMFPSKTIKRKLSKLEKLCKQIVNKKVKKSDSVNTKIKKLFNYVTWNCEYKRLYTSTEKKGWYRKSAYNMLTSKQGNCYSYASAFACLVKRATKLPVRVGWGSTPAAGGGLTPHGWCEVKINGTWYVFDPDLYRFVYSGSCYYQTMKQVGGYYYNRHYATVKFKHT